MKKLLLGLSFSVASTFAAAHPAGCGLGTHVIFKSPQNWAEHVLAATTNASASNTFAMTSGTLGCEDANGPLSIRVNVYIDSNLDEIAASMATGSGEALDALSQVIGIAETDHSHFKSLLKENFDTLFTSAQSSSADFADNLATLMSSDHKLSFYLS